MLKRSRMICIDVIVVSGIFSIYAMYDFANATKVYSISNWYIVGEFVAKPLFFVAAGFLTGSLMKVSIRDKVLIQRTLIGVGTAMMIAYCILMIIYASGNAQGFVLNVLMYVFSRQWLFLLPGLLFGIGLCESFERKGN